MISNTGVEDSAVFKPTFNVEISSNVKTPINRQGSGMIRATAFGILRYRQKWMAEIIRARGKASIIGLSKYLIALGINPIVVHGRDNGNEHAVIFNEPIRNAVGEKGKVLLMTECIEDELGYRTPTSEKTFKAYNLVGDKIGMIFQ